MCAVLCDALLCVLCVLCVCVLWAAVCVLCVCVCVCVCLCIILFRLCEVYAKCIFFVMKTKNGGVEVSLKIEKIRFCLIFAKCFFLFFLLICGKAP